MVILIWCSTIDDQGDGLECLQLADYCPTQPTLFDPQRPSDVLQSGHSMTSRILTIMASYTSIALESVRTATSAHPEDHLPCALRNSLE